MSDSNITKKALSNSFKELLQEKKFTKISVSDICNKCGMNRKSFYYHFRDKYDLVNWIFYTEFIMKMRDIETDSSWRVLEELCKFFYENKEFYRKTFGVDSQNSFSEYFRGIIGMMMKEDLEIIYGSEELEDFYIDFYADAFFCAIKRWILKRDNIDDQEFCRLIKKCMTGVAVHIVESEKESS